MKKENILNNLNKIASKDVSSWLEKAKEREANKEWLAKSAKIAIKILRELRAKKLTQKWLAEELEVSPQYINKVVKGQENLSLETISKLERVLGITLITVPAFEASIKYPVVYGHEASRIARNEAKSIATKTANYKKYSNYQPDKEESLVA